MIECMPEPGVAGVIGWPIKHSKSPLIHRFWLGKLGLDGDYSRFPVAPAQLEQFIRALPAMGLRGVNVTIPHKLAVMPFLDELEKTARDVGAVNTIVVSEGGKLKGINTDLEGVRVPLAAAASLWRPYPNHVATYVQIIGAGGAARAAFCGAAAAGFTDFDVFARDPAKAAPFAQFVGTPLGGAQPLEALGPIRNPDDGPDDQRYSHVIINASPMGMAGYPEVPINLDDYYPDTIVFDMVYAPLETGLLKAARARGLTTIDGLAMLIGQAAEAFRLFYGAEAPRQHDDELRELLTR
ncbi:shikimate dehydrogenase [Sandarakinorhabdus oryzae]|uniref:shikimate dehydrogenase n=1 Tax=Sandarakinorhabdus oryzae TaxID=2675220 RepID=UPI0012E28171|nr:shikimate dehydrogenase [Sandarakinorhabdus oryzae]